MLQDMRHLIILDFRSKSDFDRSHIRKALNVTEESYAQELLTHLADSNTCFKSHYAQDQMKRVLFILPSSGWQALEKNINCQIETLSQNAIQLGGEPLNKAFFIKDYLQFEQKYSLVCLPIEGASDK